MDIQTYIIKIVAVLLLAIIFYQDVKSRSVHLVLFISLFMVGLFQQFLYVFNFYALLKIVLFLGVNIAGLFIYYSIKNKKIFNPIDNGIGLGDVVFFLAIAPFFEFRNYMLFFISGLIISIVLYGFSVLYKKKQQTIPLAGYLSFYLGIAFILEIFTAKNLLING